MRRIAVLLLGLLPCQPAAAQVARVHLDYDTYAIGVEVMQMHAFFGLGPWNYQIRVNYHTTGLVGVFYRGTQENSVRGAWDAESALPIEFSGDGTWRGEKRITVVDYLNGEPLVKQLVPPQEAEREPVPPAMLDHTIDTLSALAQLMRQVQDTGNCTTHVRTYDGRRVLDVSAVNAGEETLDATHGSVFHGKALRCDFEGRELAGFLLGQDDPEHRRPLHGSAWLATMVPGTAPLPVRIAFQTRWFGETSMYLTGITKDPVNEMPN